MSYKTRKMRAEWWKKKQRKTSCDVISENVKESVKEFFLSAEISREVPSKHEVVRIKTQTGQKETCDDNNIRRSTQAIQNKKPES